MDLARFAKKGHPVLPQNSPKMNVEALLQFLAESRWESASSGEILEVLGNARRELEDGNPERNDGRIARLQEMELGSPSADDFLFLLRDWQRLEREVEIARLKPGLLAQAAGFQEDQWETNLYWRINDAILAFKEGDRDELFATAQSIRELLTSSWDSYMESASSVEGTTAEAELGQRVLEDSFTLFHSAVDEMEDAADGQEGSFGQALRCAETASRRMMAVQALNEKILSRPSEDVPAEEDQGGNR
jgi:hypothetical protein